MRLHTRGVVMPTVKSPALQKARKAKEDARRAKVLAMIESGKTVVEVAAKLKLHRATVYTIIKGN